MLTAPVLDDGITPVPLVLFTMGDLNDSRSLVQFRPVYSPRSRIRGDNKPQPTAIEFSGIVSGDSMNSMLVRRDAIMAAARRGEQWLKFQSGGETVDRMLRVGRALRRTSQFLDQRGMRVIRLDLQLELIAPYWQSLEEKVMMAPVVVGPNNFTLENEGNTVAYPVFTFTGSSITQVTVSIEGRSLTWARDEPLGFSVLMIDCVRGEVTVDGAPSLFQVQDNSLFPELMAGGPSNLFVQVIGGAGQITTSFRDAWEL